MEATVKKKQRTPTWFRIFIALLAMGIGVTVGLFVYIRSSTPADLNNVQVVTSRVGVLYQLPSDEDPALLTVTDKSKVSSRLAQKVQNGDKLLIYQKNQQAIIYRPSINKIIGVVPVDIDDIPTGSRDNK